MQNSPLISIIMPTYNEAPVVEEAIRSILNQTIGDFELIIVDGGSTDGTVDTIKQTGDDRITIISEQEPKGISHALNRGIDAAHGEYIARMDADDRSNPERLERQIKVLKSSPSTILVTCWYTAITQAGNTITTRRVDTSRSFSPREIVERGPGFAHGSVVARKEAFEETGGYRSSFDSAEDLDLWIRIAEKFGGDSFHVIPEPLYERRICSDQMVRRQRQRVVTKYVIKAARCRWNGEQEPLGEAEKAVQNLSESSYSERERKALYHYMIGIQYLEENKITKSRKQFLQSVVSYPLIIHPWYKLVLSIFPKPIRQKSQQIVQRFIMG